METDLNSKVLKEPASPQPYFGISTQKMYKMRPQSFIKSKDKNSHEEPNLFMKTSLPMNALTYELEKFKKKIVLIFNNKHFLHHQVRHGTEKDAESLKSTFGYFDFEVYEYKDYERHKIFDVLNEFLKQDLTDYGCVTVAILTHGDKNGLLYALDEPYRETDIIKLFRHDVNPSLFMKPKVLIIEACRGQNLDTGMPVLQPERDRVLVRDISNDIQPFFLPLDTDMLVLHSSYPGNVSYRNTVHGSWFIQTLCNKIKANGDNLDLEAIITLVKNEVAINKQHEVFHTSANRMSISKQMPVVTSTLIRKLFLRKYGHAPEQFKYHEGKTIINNETGSQIRYLDIPKSENGQDSSCSCYLKHFNYLKMCLKDYIIECPHDEMGKTYLEVADSFNDSAEFNMSKTKMTKIIANHLKENANNCKFYKYIFMNDL